MPDKYLTMSNGVKQPILGLGTWQSKGSDVKLAVETALKAGYKLIDTAQAYDNEEQIGEAVSKMLQSGLVSRSDIFITTKLLGYNHHKENVERSLRESLRKLRMDYVDLFLIHTPMAAQKVEGYLLPIINGELAGDVVDHMETWQAMEGVYNKRLTRSIGLSNFNRKQMQNIIDHCSVKPHNLQVECHVYWPQYELHDFCKSHDITFTAYGCLGSPGLKQFAKLTEMATPLMDETVKRIASAHQKTPAQIMLCWLINRGIAVIPKSVRPERIKENNDVFDIHLSEEEMKELSNLSTRERLFKFPWGAKHPDFPFKDD